jgi:dipeptidyl aminopeptidase/acylaminoacyl peptidase
LRLETYQEQNRRVSKLIGRATLLILTVTVVVTVPSRPITAQAVRRPVTIDDLMKLRAIVDVRLSPDGELVAYVVSTPVLSSNEHDGALFVVPARGGTPRRIGEDIHIFNTPSPVPRVRWSPDGELVTLMGLDGTRPQVMAIPVGGGPARKLTAAPEGVFGYEWSPDGKQIAYLTRDPISDDEAARRKDRSFIIRADARDVAVRLAVQPVDGTGDARPPRFLTPSSQYVDSLSWSPDGREIAYSASSRSGFMGPYFTRIYSVTAATGAARSIVDRPGMNTGPRFSPDGRSIAFITTGGRVEIMASRSLAVVPAAGSAAPHVFGLDDAWVNEYVWSADSSAIYLQANDGTFGRHAQMFEQPIVRLTVADGKAARLDPQGGAVVNFSISASRNGRRLAYRSVDGRTMGDVVVLDVASRQVTKLTDVNPELRAMALGKLEPISWRSFDGMEIWGLLLTPPDAMAGRRLPLLTYIHGGPGGGVTYGIFPQFMTGIGQVDPYPTEALASAGYAVLFPMPRGGAGYGEAGQRMIVNSWGEADYKDIMAGVDKLVADGVADADRLGVMGASYGGFMTNWIVTQTGRFKAASAGASISDLTDLYLLSEGGEFIVDYFKRPWENRQSFTSHSPITFADRVTTPLLIQHGEVDPRVPVAEAWKFYRTLKAMGKTVEIEIYPRGGHVLREPMQQREQMRNNLAWFARWIPANRE